MRLLMKREKKEFELSFKRKSRQSNLCKRFVKKDNLVTVLWSALTNCSETVTIS